jgi:hypothetical protein
MHDSICEPLVLEKGTNKVWCSARNSQLEMKRGKRGNFAAKMPREEANSIENFLQHDE